MNDECVPRSEALRWHLDWWEKCRTCIHWDGNRISNGIDLAPCGHPKPMKGAEETCSEGHCDQWSSFDEDVAYLILHTCYACDTQNKIHEAYAFFDDLYKKWKVEEDEKCAKLRIGLGLKAGEYVFAPYVELPPISTTYTKEGK